MAQADALPALTLVGPGRAGAALARAWRRAGGNVEAILSRDASAAAALARELSSRPASLESPGQNAADLIVLAVPDDAIAAVARQLAPTLAARAAFHLSGSRGSEDLEPFARRGAVIASMHPLRPFTGNASESWRGALVAIEGSDEASRLAERIARTLGARSHRLEAGAKALYHLAATLAAGGTMALLSMASSLWTEAGLAAEEAREALAGLAEHAARAFGTASDPSAAFTGPLARRDMATIRAHWEALAAKPELASLYAALARETLRHTPGRGGESEILRMLEKRSAR